MEQPVLTDKHQFPTEAIIFSNIGRTKALWLRLFESIHQNHPDFAEEWKYYLDGRSWLLKVTRKSKTVFWLSVVERSFRTTFYFTDNAQQAIEKSSLPDEVKKQYRSGAKIGKLRAITILHKTKGDVESAMQLIGIKIGNR